MKANRYDSISKLNDARIQRIADLEHVIARFIRASETVLTGLNARIEHANKQKEPVPVFDGIARLHSALCTARRYAPNALRHEDDPENPPVLRRGE